MAGRWLWCNVEDKAANKAQFNRKVAAVAVLTDADNLKMQQSLVVHSASSWTLQRLKFNMVSHHKLSPGGGNRLRDRHKYKLS